MKRIISITIITILILTVYGSAAAIDLTRNDGQITLQLKHGGTILKNVNVSLYKVANVDASCKYTLTDAFAGSGVNLNINSTGNKVVDAGVNRTLSATLLEYAKTNSISPTLAKSNNNGVAVFTGLTPGMYLVAQTNDKDANGYTMLSALIQLPAFDNGKWIYSIASEPKTEPTPTKPPTPTDPPTTPAPKDPDVDIPDEEVPQTNPGDPETPERTDPKDPWDIKIDTEKPPLADLPQTGQLRWPIPILASVGILLTITGAWMQGIKKRKELKAALAKIPIQSPD